MSRRNYGTNQNVIAQPGIAHIYTTGRQNKLFPQMFNQFVTPTQLEHIGEGHNFCEHRKLRISVSGSIRNKVFPERLLSVPDNYRSPQNNLTLPLQLIFSQRLAIEAKNAPSRSLKAEALIPRVMPDPLEMP